MNEAAEIVVLYQPFTVRRTARWADCDPAGVVYAGCYAEYLIGAITYFLKHVGFSVGATRAHGIGLPCKHMSLTFHISLHPDDVVDIQIGVGEIRKHTFDLIARAYLPYERLAFEGVFTPICIHREVRESAPIPPLLREALQPHAMLSKEATA